MNKLDLTALLERVRNATGPDRELDAAILIALECIDEAPWDIIVGSDVINKLAGRTYSHPAPITYSIDAALALVERVLPGWQWCLNRLGQPMALVNNGPGVQFECELAETVPLAILTALLLALTSNQEGNDEA